MKTSVVPTPGVSFNKLISANVVGPFVFAVSGELSVNKTGVPFASPSMGCRVSNVWLSVAASGKDNSNTLSVEVDVKVNGTSCLTTKPKIAHVSGEASQQKTTKITGDTGITQSVMNSTYNLTTSGDVLTYDVSLTRTSSPTTEMSNLVCVVEVEPVK